MQNNTNNIHDFRLIRQMMQPPIQPRNYKSYSCTLCGKLFSSPQALGGHKRAHRKEMEEMRTSKVVTPSGPSISDHTKINDGEHVAATSNVQGNEASLDLELSLRPCGEVDLSLRL